MYRGAAAAAVLIALATPSVARGQILPTEPVSVGDGRVVIGAEVSATMATSDPGFFNYTDYEYSALRNFRVGVTAEVRASQRVQVLGEVRVDHGDLVQPFALYARIRPWPERRFDIQVGRIPPTFGAFGRGSYGATNLLIGIPLPYQYLTSLRPDALPAVPEDLVRMSGRGWLSNFPLGNLAADRGLPLMNSSRWDTGVQVHGVNGMVEWSGAITTGSLSNPRVDDDNDGRQIAGRAVLRPAAPIAIGMSVARGAFLSRTLETVLAPGRRIDDGVQQAWGLDGEYSQGRFLARSEMIWSRWTLPVAWPRDENPRLGAMSALVEARYRIFPGIHIAARGEHLGFNRIQTASGPQPWEAPVRRLEIGGGYSVIRNVMLKASFQRHVRDGGRVRRHSIGALQVVYWF
jgi:hypothetical protein